jgi:hypothetical protein
MQGDSVVRSFQGDGNAPVSQTEENGGMFHTPFQVTQYPSSFFLKIASFDATCSYYRTSCIVNK